MALFLCLLTVLAVGQTTALGREVPDQSKRGTITIQWKYQGKYLSNGQLRAYRLATVVDNDGDMEFQPLPAYRGKTLTQKRLTPELAREMAARVDEDDAIKPTGIKEGVVTFSGLKLGLYLIVQTKSVNGYEDIAPFFVSVPLWDEDEETYLYEINAVGKYELKRNLPSGSENGSSGGSAGGSSGTANKLPQTGQLNWPVPVLLAFGVLCIVSGVALRRREDHA